MEVLVPVTRGGERETGVFWAAPPAACSCRRHTAEAEQTGWMLANISCVQDGAAFALALSLHIQRQMFPKARVEG